jgi:hypothetical protein
MLNSDDLRQQAARAALEKDSAKSAALAELGLGALADRRYTRAYELFVAAGRAGMSGPQIRTIALYCLFMTKDHEGRVALVQKLKEAGASADLQPWVVPLLDQLAHR